MKKDTAAAVKDAGNAHQAHTLDQSIDHSRLAQRAHDFMSDQTNRPKKVLPELEDDRGDKKI